MKNFNRGGGFGDKRGGGDFGRRDSGSRDSSRGGDRGRDGARPEMHRAVCAECGENCEVPFKPSGDRPVLCSNCFKGKDGGESRGESRRDSRPERSFGRDSRPSFGDKRMFEAVCDECGKDCEVPFQPSSGKPVYCSDCFGKNGNTKASNGHGASNGQFELLNAKLDKIMKALKLEVMSEPVAKKEKAFTPKAKAVAVNEDFAFPAVEEEAVVEKVPAAKKSAKKVAKKIVASKAKTAKRPKRK